MQQLIALSCHTTNAMCISQIHNGYAHAFFFQRKRTNVNPTIAVQPENNQRPGQAHICSIPDAQLDVQSSISMH